MGAVLEEAEARVARLEEAVRDRWRRPAPVVSLASSVTRTGGPTCAGS